MSGKAPVLVVSPLPEESAPLVRRLRRRRRLGDSTAWRGEIGHRQVVVAVVGAGRAAGSATGSWLQRTDAVAVLLLGFAASLDPRLGPGSCVCALDLCGGDGSGAHALDPGWSAWLRPAVDDAGRLITVPEVLRGAEAKHRARRRAGEGALAADMESLFVAEEAARAGVPASVVRAVTDGFDEDLPHWILRHLDADGTPSRRRMVLEVARRPAAWRSAIAYGRRSRLAAARLGRAGLRALEWPGLPG